MSLSGLYAVSAERGVPARVIVGVGVIAVLLPAVMVTGWLASLSAKAERTQVERSVGQHAREISAILDREVTGIGSALAALATSSSLHNGNLRGFHAKASEIAQQLGLQIGLYDARAQRHVLNTAVPFGTALSGYSFPHVPAAADGRRDALVTGVIFDPLRDRHGVAIVLRARPADDLDYLLAAMLDAAKVTDVLDLVQLQPAYAALVIDRNGLIIAQSGGRDDSIGKPAPPQLLSPAAGPRASTADGELRWFRQRSDATGWTVLIGAPRAAFDSSFRQVSRLLAAAGFALIAGGLAVAYVVGRAFSRAASELGSAVRALPRQAPLPAASTSIREARAVLDDVKAASSDLRVTDAQQRFAIEAAGIGTWSWDMVQDRRTWSDRARELFGVPADAEATVENLLAAMHPADRHVIRKSLSGIRGMDGYDVEFRICTGDGAPERWISSKGRVERDSAGRPVFMHGVVHDITERRTSELERAELRRRLGHAQEEERLRLARELHDQTGQSLTAAALDLARIERAVGEGARKRVASLRDRLHEIGDTVHRIARELRPAALDGVDLRTALAEHLDAWGSTYGIATQIRFDCRRTAAAALPDEVKTAIFRIAQEALTNVARHAGGASAVSLVVSCRDAFVQMTIEDNGCGFDSASAPGRDGLGLAGMRERAALVGGSLEIESLSQVGTAIFVRVPLDKWSQAA